MEGMVENTPVLLGRRAEEKLVMKKMSQLECIPDLSSNLIADFLSPIPVAVGFVMRTPPKGPDSSLV